MDTASFLFGMSMASGLWLCFYPWSAMARLRELEARAAETSGIE